MNIFGCVFSFSFGGWVHYDNHKADYYGIEIRESRLDEFEKFFNKIYQSDFVCFF